MKKPDPDLIPRNVAQVRERIVQACVTYQRHEWLRGALLLLLERLTNYQRIKRPRRRDIVAHAIAAAAAALRGAAATRRGSQADDAIAALPRPSERQGMLQGETMHAKDSRRVQPTPHPPPLAQASSLTARRAD